jgi:hypothetical protein
MKWTAAVKEYRDQLIRYWRNCLFVEWRIRAVLVKWIQNHTNPVNVVCNWSFLARAMHKFIALCCVHKIYEKEEKVTVAASITFCHSWKAQNYVKIIWLLIYRNYYWAELKGGIIYTVNCHSSCHYRTHSKHPTQKRRVTLTNLTEEQISLPAQWLLWSFRRRIMAAGASCCPLILFQCRG